MKIVGGLIFSALIFGELDGMLHQRSQCMACSESGIGNASKIADLDVNCRVGPVSGRTGRTAEFMTPSTSCDIVCETPNDAETTIEDKSPWQELAEHLKRPTRLDQSTSHRGESSIRCFVAERQPRPFNTDIAKGFNFRTIFFPIHNTRLISIPSPASYRPSRMETSACRLLVASVSITAAKGNSTCSDFPPKTKETQIVTRFASPTRGRNGVVQFWAGTRNS